MIFFGQFLLETWNFSSLVSAIKWVVWGVLKPIYNLLGYIGMTLWWNLIMDSVSDYIYSFQSRDRYTCHKFWFTVKCIGLLSLLLQAGCAFFLYLLKGLDMYMLLIMCILLILFLKKQKETGQPLKLFGAEVCRLIDITNFSQLVLCTAGCNC